MAPASSRSAAQVGLTKQALLHHFGSKQKLYGAVLERISARLLADLDDCANGVAPEQAFEQALLRHPCAHPAAPAGRHPAADARAAPTTAAAPPRRAFGTCGPSLTPCTGNAAERPAGPRATPGPTRAPSPPMSINCWARSTTSPCPRPRCKRCTAPSTSPPCARPSPPTCASSRGCRRLRPPRPRPTSPLPWAARHRGDPRDDAPAAWPVPAPVLGPVTVDPGRPGLAAAPGGAGGPGTPAAPATRRCRDLAA